jgi:hypothetical protein
MAIPAQIDMASLVGVNKKETEVEMRAFVFLLQRLTEPVNAIKGVKFRNSESSQYGGGLYGPSGIIYLFRIVSNFHVSSF